MLPLTSMPGFRQLLHVKLCGSLLDRPENSLSQTKAQYYRATKGWVLPRWSLPHLHPKIPRRYIVYSDFLCFPLLNELDIVYGKVWSMPDFAKNAWTWFFSKNVLEFPNTGNNLSDSNLKFWARNNFLATLDHRSQTWDLVSNVSNKKIFIDQGRRTSSLRKTWSKFHLSST